MNVSQEYALILNLRNTAIDHKNLCEHNCNVSLYQLKETAKFIYNYMVIMERKEIKEALTLIEEMPIT